MNLQNIFAAILSIEWNEIVLLMWVALASIATISVILDRIIVSVASRDDA